MRLVQNVQIMIILRDILVNFPDFIESLKKASPQPSPEGKGEGWYDLGGRLITPPSGGDGGGLQPGLYIKNGKKVVVSRLR